MGLSAVAGLAMSAFGAYNQYKQRQDQKKALKKSEPRSAEELQKESRAKAEVLRLGRAKDKKKYGTTNFSGPTGVQGQLKDKVGE